MGWLESMPSFDGESWLTWARCDLPLIPQPWERWSSVLRGCAPTDLSDFLSAYEIGSELRGILGEILPLPLAEPRNVRHPPLGIAPAGHDEEKIAEAIEVDDDLRGVTDLRLSAQADHIAFCPSAGGPGQMEMGGGDRTAWKDEIAQGGKGFVQLIDPLFQ